MINFIAPNPYPVPKQNFIFEFFSSFSSSPTSFSVGEPIGELVLPAQWRQPQTITENKITQVENYNAVTIDGGFIYTHDEAALDTIEIIPNQIQEVPIEKRRFIIKFNGNGGQYQDLFENYANDAQTLNAAVIGFNYRGVGQSIKAPKVFQDLITDGIAQVQRLLSKGANPENILLDGHSLGGGIATMVAQHFHNLNQRVYLWNDRSFASLSKAAAGIIAPNLPGILDDVLQTSIESSSWSVMKPSGWDVDVAAAYNSIPANFKGYMVVAKPSDKSLGDGVISHPASLHKSVKQSEKQQHISTGHKVITSPDFFRKGHNLSRSQLISKENSEENGQALFANFSRRLGS